MRRRRAEKREVLPDPMYKSITLSKFINYVMLDGKKNASEKIVYGALQIIKKKVSDMSPLDFFESTLAKIMPKVEVRSRRVGGATYQVPVEVRQERRVALAMRWLVNAARSRNEHGMEARLAGELLDAAEGRGGARKKLEETIRMAQANAAFAFFRW